MASALIQKSIFCMYSNNRKQNCLNDFAQMESALKEMHKNQGYYVIQAVS